MAFGFSDLMKQKLFCTSSLDTTKCVLFSWSLLEFIHFSSVLTQVF